jgi:D-glycero-D-manno-heptose 1,7-bisphosphate phosphatase
MKRLILLDRDGTILSPPRNAYVRGWQDVTLRADVLQVVVRASQHGHVVGLVSNQSCVGRRLVTQAWVDEVNVWLVDAVRRAGGSLDFALTCPHVDADRCACRKPRPGLLRLAAELSGMPLESAWMIGDAHPDLEASRAAGVERFLHACPGRGNCVCAAEDAYCLGGDMLSALAALM